jgi:hypothetical protein
MTAEAWVPEHEELLSMKQGELVALVMELNEERIRAWLRVNVLSGALERIGAQDADEMEWEDEDKLGEYASAILRTVRIYRGGDDQSGLLAAISEVNGRY